MEKEIWTWDKLQKTIDWAEIIYKLDKEAMAAIRHSIKKAKEKELELYECPNLFKEIDNIMRISYTKARNKRNIDLSSIGIMALMKDSETLEPGQGE